MTDGTAIGLVAIAGALLLAGRAAVVRSRGNPNVGRYALIWAAVFAIAFGIALALRR